MEKGKSFICDERKGSLQNIYRIEEIEVERRINSVALLFSGFFTIYLLILPLLTHSGYDNLNNISNLIGIGIYLLYNIAVFVLRKKGFYHPALKYITVAMTASAVSVVMLGYSFGVDFVHATRSVTMTTYFIAIALSGLYQNAALPLYCAALISIEYLLLYILAMLSGQAVLFRMETFRDNIMSWDILVVNVIAFMGTGLLMNLITRRHKKLSLQLQESSEKLLREEEESRHNQEKVRFFENYDLLTRLPNMDHFRQRLEREILKAESRKQVFAVMCLGLDSFKKVNQLHGMETGHLVLREVGLRLKDSFREDDSICRFMGDKFLVLLSDLSASEDMGDLIRKTRLALSSPFPAKAGDIAVTASGGLCAYPHDALTASALIENAEAAMYLAKNDGKGVFRLWDKRMHEELDLRVRMEIELEQALKRNELYLVFQPIVDLRGTVKCMETLLRWKSPTRGLVPPDRFIPIAESSGLIVEIGYLVFKLCCSQIRLWSAMGQSPLRITVNVSPHQFAQKDFVPRVISIIEEEGIDPRWLGIEITESGIMSNEEECVEKMNGLKAYGLTISIDDFGKGYSSLTRLGSYPLDNLKIDKAFVDGLPSSDSSVCIVRSIIDLAHNLGYKVIAEGVETESQRDFLAKNSCDLFQGYLYHKPLPPDQIAVLLEGAKGG